MKPAVTFEGIWKKFRRGERHNSLRDMVPELVRRAVGRGDPSMLRDREFWALHDVSFEVRPGEALGIIGPNGAGKSTALKLLTKILRPTRGQCGVHGRVGALIEVAAGFHPDLTGRENTFLQGAIMGMKPAEIRARFDEIVEFAGIGEFIDTPAKRYSSGMNARLGFSIAAHLSPDVMLIDEVLSVGDVQFQQRCAERMLEFKRQGVAMVFVSHHLEAVRRLCERTLYLRQAARALGPTDMVLQRYLQDIHEGEHLHEGGIAITRSELLAEDGPVDAGHVNPRQHLRLRVDYRFDRPLMECTLGFLIHRSTDDLVVYDAGVTENQLGLTQFEPGAMTVEFSFDANLTRGHYHVECHVFDNRRHQFLARRRPAAQFTVHESVTFAGVADVCMTVRRVEPPGASNAPQRHHVVGVARS